jgi:hypothetical protein
VLANQALNLHKMEQEIKNILEKRIKDNLQLKDKVDNLRNKIRFCSEHKFEEEKNCIIRIKRN